MLINKTYSYHSLDVMREQGRDLTFREFTIKSITHSSLSFIRKLTLMKEMEKMMPSMFLGTQVTSREAKKKTSP